MFGKGAWAVRPFLVAVASLLLTLGTRSSFAEAVAAESLEWAVADSDLLLRGHVEEATGPQGNENDYARWETVGFKVSGALKGEVPDRVSFVVRHTKDWRVLPPFKEAEGEMLVFLVKADRYQDRGEGYRGRQWALRDGSAAVSVVPLDGKSPIEVACMDRRILSRGDEILKAVRQALEAAPGHKELRYTFIDFPTSTEMLKKLWHGSGVALIVPVDGRLEALGREWIRSEDPWLRRTGAGALRHFQSEENVALLKPLLSDGASYIRDAGGRQFLLFGASRKRVYFLRGAAYRVLQQWKVKVDAPVLEEYTSADK